MATLKLAGGVSHFYDKQVGGMATRGCPEDFAEWTFKQIAGFGCGSACKKDPASGVIGVQKGTTIPMV